MEGILLGAFRDTRFKSEDVADVLVGALNFSGVTVLGAVVLALLLAGALIGLRRLSPSNPLSGDQTNRTRLNLHLPSR